MIAQLQGCSEEQICGHTKAELWNMTCTGFICRNRFKQHWETTANIPVSSPLQGRWQRLTVPCSSSPKHIKYSGNNSTNNHKCRWKVERGGQTSWGPQDWGATLQWDPWVFFLLSIYPTLGARKARDPSFSSNLQSGWLIPHSIPAESAARFTAATMSADTWGNRGPNWLQQQCQQRPVRNQSLGLHNSSGPNPSQCQWGHPLALGDSGGCGLLKHQQWSCSTPWAAAGPVYGRGSEHWPVSPGLPTHISGEPRQHEQGLNGRCRGARSRKPNRTALQRLNSNLSLEL